MINTLPTHYRVTDFLDEKGVTVRLEQWNPVRETPAGYWVKSQYAPVWMEFPQLKRGKYLKWVGKSSRRRHCYPTIEEAISSFKRRKEVQESRLRLQIEQAQLILSSMSKIDLSDSNKTCELGHTESSANLVWDY